MKPTTKKQKVSDEGVPDTSSVLLTPTIVKLLAMSNMMSIREHGRLSQTCRANHNVLQDDEVWASMLNHMDYKIPKNVIAKLGHKWIIKEVTLHKHTLPPTLPAMPPPRLSSDDMMIIYEIVCEDPNGVMKVSKGTLPASCMDSLFSEGGTYECIDPIVIGEAEVARVTPSTWCPNRRSVDIRAKGIDELAIRARLHLVRIPDKEMCCIFGCPGNVLGVEFNAEQGNVRVYQLDGSDIDLDTHDFDDPQISGGLENYFDFNDGCWELGSMTVENYAPEGEEFWLKIRRSPMGLEIMSRFHYTVYFHVRLGMGVTPEKKVIIEGFWLDAVKAAFDSHDNERDVIRSGDSKNNGVTLAHILSELASS